VPGLFRQLSGLPGGQRVSPVAGLAA